MTGGEEWHRVNKLFLGDCVSQGSSSPDSIPRMEERHSSGRASLKNTLLPSKNNTGLARPQKGGIPHGFPLVTQEIRAELVLKRHKHRERRKTQSDPGFGRGSGKIPSCLAARTAGVERTAKGKSQKERSLGFLAKPDTEEQPQFWNAGTKADISSVPILRR